MFNKGESYVCLWGFYVVIFSSLMLFPFMPKEPQHIHATKASNLDLLSIHAKNLNPCRFAADWFQLCV